MKLTNKYMMNNWLFIRSKLTFDW